MQFMKHHRGQGLSLTTIVIAAVSLIVLVVLVAIFTGRINLFNIGVGQVGESEVACQNLCRGLGKTGSLDIGSGLVLCNEGDRVGGLFRNRAGEEGICCCS